MDRRRFMGTSATGAAGLVAGGSRADGESGNGPPNIVIIMADDLGFGDLGCYGSKLIRTPYIDKLAGEGVRLTSFYSSGPVCSPSRAGLLTGRYPARSGVHYVFVPTYLLGLAMADYTIFQMPWGLPRNEITLAEALKQADYSTCCIGKWHLGDLPRYQPRSRGFDHYYGVLHSNDVPRLHLRRNDEIVEKNVDQDYLTRNYTNEAVDWIGDNAGSPFLLYFAHTFPHVPLHSSPDYRGRSWGGQYGDVVEELDWSVGEVMAALDRAGIADNTFVFFTSDNGPWFEGSPGPYRGRKGETFEGGMRVPGIARWPGVIPAGETRDAMSMNFDLFTTSLAMAGLAPPSDRAIDGEDILPMLKGDEGSPHDALFFHKYKSPQAVRSQKWKYRRESYFQTTNFPYYKKGPMLFDLGNDPGENYNVIGLYPDVAEAMAEMIVQHERYFERGAPRRRY